MFYEQDVEIIQYDNRIKPQNQEVAEECGRVFHKQWRWRLAHQLIVSQGSSFLPLAIFLMLEQGGNSTFMSEVILWVLIALPVVSEKV